MSQPIARRRLLAWLGGLQGLAAVGACQGAEEDSEKSRRKGGYEY